MVTQLVSMLPLLGSLAFVVYLVVVAIVVITDDRDPTSTLAWLLLLWAFPVVGLGFYYLFGRNWKKKAAKDPRIAAVRALAAPTMQRIQALHESAHEDTLAWALDTGYEDVVRMIERTEHTTALPAYDVEILLDGGHKFAAFKRDLAAATETINLLYYIWEDDDLTSEVADILLERHAAGVEIRMLTDFIGTIFYRKRDIGRLRRAGIASHSDITDLGRVNYRNHRKIAVIDGKIGYTGGINVGQEYIDGGRRFPSWRDTHVRFTGPAVAQLQSLFAHSWYLRTGENLYTERCFPATYPHNGRRTLAQVVSTGVDQPWEPARRAHVTGFSAAKERVWIQSPYLVPTPEVLSALIDTALAGLDVRIMMTGLPDKRSAWFAAETFFAQLIDAGVRIFRYNAGFMHSKTMTIDGRIAVIGTMNLDIRSLALHQELMVWFYDADLACQHEQAFLKDMESCEEITRETIESWGPIRHLRNASARLAANLL